MLRSSDSCREKLGGAADGGGGTAQVAAQISAIVEVAVKFVTKEEHACKIITTGDAPIPSLHLQIFRSF